MKSNKTSPSFKPHFLKNKNKLFIGGLKPETSIKDINDYFSIYGKVESAYIMIDKETNLSRRFGFVSMENINSIMKILNLQPHFILNKQVEVKLALPDSSPIESKKEIRHDNNRKIFIGGVGKSLSERELVEYFIKYGEISECFIKRNNGVSRGFGFLIFKHTYSIERLFKKENLLKIRINSSLIDVKRAVHRENFIPEELKQEGIFNEKLLFLSYFNDSSKQSNLSNDDEVYFASTDISIDSDSNKEIIKMICNEDNHDL